MSALHMVSFKVEEDQRCWNIDSSGVFSVNSLSMSRNSAPLPKEIYAVLWKSNSPKKVSVLHWILINGKVNTAEVLLKKVPNMHLQPSICVLCADSCASGVHLLLFICNGLLGFLISAVQTSLGFCIRRYNDSILIIIWSIAISQGPLTMG